MATTRLPGALPMFQHLGRPAAAVSAVVLVATLLGISPISASTTPDIAPTTSIALSTRTATIPAALPTADPPACGTPSGGFSSAPGMYAPDPGEPSTTGCDFGMAELPADLGTPSGGFSSAPGMSPATTVRPR